MSDKGLLHSIAHFIIIKTTSKGKMLCSSPLAVASNTGEVKRLSLFSCYRHAFTLVLCQLERYTVSATERLSSSWYDSGGNLGPISFLNQPVVFFRH